MIVFILALLKKDIRKDKLTMCEHNFYIYNEKKENGKIIITWKCSKCGQERKEIY